ncbi:MAG: GNAT family N-acetyltransferase [Chitinophagaceae bacterium]
MSGDALNSLIAGRGIDNRSIKQMNNLKIRDATIQDVPTLLQFEQEIIQAEREFDDSLKEGHIHYYDFPFLVTSSLAKVMVAEINNEIVGSGYAVIKEAEPYLRHSRFAYIGLMYVKPAHRGRGINQQVLQVLKEWLTENNISELRLVVYNDNLTAKNAYLKAGFNAHVLEMRMKL